jgi:hypothetical protein
MWHLLCPYPISFPEEALKVFKCFQINGHVLRLRHIDIFEEIPACIPGEEKSSRYL